MKDLVLVKRGNAVASSLDVAELFHKRHDNVLRDIENLTSDLLKFEDVKMFFRSSYVDAKGEKRPLYYMNRDGFSLLAMGFTGKRALAFKLAFIAEFNRMEAVLAEKQTTEWLETRKTGKLTRRSETDVIKELVDYAKGQGSRHADMLYMTYSKLANKTAGIANRDEATIKQLNILDDVEAMILHVIRLGMAGSKHYKEIYQDCKHRLEWWQDCTFRLSASEGRKEAAA